MRKTSIYLILSSLLLAVMMSGSLMAQTAMTWTGAVSTDGSDPANWEPQIAVDGNDLTIDSLSKVTSGRMPVFSGSDSIEVNSLSIDPTGEITIAFDDSLILFNITTEYFEPHGIINIDEGTLQGRRCHIEDTNTVVNIKSGGIYVARKYFFMSGDGNDRPTAGYINIEGTGKAIYDASQGGAFGRFPVDTTTGVITLNPFGTLDLKGNWVDDVNALIAKNQIMAAEGYNVVVEYDAGNDWTYVYIQDATVFIIEPTDPVRLYEDEEGDTIKVVKNEGYDAMSGFEWKYSTTSGSGYTSFSPAQTNDYIVPSFADPGHYYLVCEGTKTAGGTVISNEVEVFVASSLVVVDPPDDQNLRAGLDGAMLTVTKDASITGVEWKWSSTLGSGYASFSPAQTGDEYTPNFDANGAYYVICEGTDGSNTYMSRDIMVIVGDASMNITWNGSKSNSARAAANWTPLANVDGNTVNVDDTSTWDNPLIFSGPGNLNINKIYLNDTLSTMTVDMGTDTLRVSGNSYGIAGELTIKSGVFNYKDLRHERTTGRIIVEGGEFLIRDSYFMMGNKNGDAGSYLDIKGDGKFISLVKQPDRFSSDSLMSVITISENGMLQVPDDWRGGAETRMAKNQLKVPDPDLEELVVTLVIEGDDTVATRITAKSLLKFEIDPLDDQLVGTGESVATISTINDDDRTSFEWKYATESGGTYMSFSPAETENTFSGSFDATGDYYVICEGYGTDTVMSSEVMIQVVSVSIAPEDDQNIMVSEQGTMLTVTESMTADSREWKSSTTSGSGYTPVVPPATGATWTPFFTTDGTYYVVCASTFGDKTVNSNEVTVVVVPVAVDENALRSISFYPNPAREAFYINAGEYNSFSIKISDLTGRTVLEREFMNVSGPQKIALDHRGIYFVSISTADGTHTVKMIMK